MNLPRLTHDPAMLVAFFEEGLTALGAICERIWHDRLEVLAEGRSAALWTGSGGLVERQLHFVLPDLDGARNADTEVFPGCPLTFHLAEALRTNPLPIERAVLQAFDNGRPPGAE